MAMNFGRAVSSNPAQVGKPFRLIFATYDNNDVLPSSAAESLCRPRGGRAEKLVDPLQWKIKFINLLTIG